MGLKQAAAGAEERGERWGWQEWTVTHHQFMAGWRNAGSSHLWEEQRKGKVSILIPIENQGLLRSFRSPPPRAGHPFLQFTNTDTLQREDYGATRKAASAITLRGWGKRQKAKVKCKSHFLNSVKKYTEKLEVKAPGLR